MFAFSGNVDQEYSKGCNYLIQQDKAHLITSAADLMRIMGWEERNFCPVQPQLFQKLSDEKIKLLDICVKI
ncbi:MAG: hypothetical protein IPM74_16880 [Crocinitomicaceae bacterium]|nr:hypothetical protein [Crocinitomicaceae bacterium]